MKCEARGKYSGTKVHLDGEECKEILDFLDPNCVFSAALPQKFVTKLGRKIKALLTEHPDLLKERTEEQVQAALLKDQKKIVQQLEALEKGKDWKF